MNIVGYGVTVAAADGTQINRVPNRGDTLISAWSTGNGLSNAMVTVEGGQARLVQPPRGGSGGLTVTDEPGAQQPHWTVVDAGLSCAWPEAVLLWAGNPNTAAWDTEFHGPDNGLVVLRGPLAKNQVPPPDALVAPYQTVIASDMASEQMWLELAYEHDGTRWRQRHQYAVIAPETVVLVTGQAVDGQHQAICNAVHIIARTLRRM